MGIQTPWLDAGPLITMIKRMRTSRLSIKNSRSGVQVRVVAAAGKHQPPKPSPYTCSYNTQTQSEQVRTTSKPGSYTWIGSCGCCSGGGTWPRRPSSHTLSHTLSHALSLSHPLTLSLYHSLTLSLSHSLTLSLISQTVSSRTRPEAPLWRARASERGE